jgi:hypothetical protein
VIKTLKDLPLPPKDKKMLVIEPLQMKTEDDGEVGALPIEEDGVVINKEVTTDASSEKTIAA